MVVEAGNQNCEHPIEKMPLILSHQFLHTAFISKLVKMMRFLLKGIIF